MILCTVTDQRREAIAGDAVGVLLVVAVTETLIHRGRPQRIGSTLRSIWSVMSASYLSSAGHHRPAPATSLDFGDGFGFAFPDGGLQRGVVEFVLVGVGFGEVGDGLVELV